MFSYTSYVFTWALCRAFAEQCGGKTEWATCSNLGLENNTMQGLESSVESLADTVLSSNMNVYTIYQVPAVPWDMHLALGNTKSHTLSTSHLWPLNPPAPYHTHSPSSTPFINYKCGLSFELVDWYGCSIVWCRCSPRPTSTLWMANMTRKSCRTCWISLSRNTSCALIAATRKPIWYVILWLFSCCRIA